MGTVDSHLTVLKQVTVEILEYPDFKLIQTKLEKGQNKQDIDEILFLYLWTFNHNKCSDL